jgi:hypothetical protein
LRRGTAAHGTRQRSACRSPCLILVGNGVARLASASRLTLAWRGPWRSRRR